MVLEYKSWDKVLDTDVIVMEEVTDRDTAIAKTRKLARASHADSSLAFSDILLHYVAGDEGEEMSMWYDDEMIDCMREDEEECT